MSKTITAKTFAWMTEYSSLGPDDLKRASPGLVHALSFSSNECMKSAGWTLAGEAEITVHLVDPQTLIDNKVASLRAEQKKTVADAQLKSTQIERQIQQLLAITYEPEEA